MHEFSLMDSLVETVNESARQAGATNVLSIDLVVGELTQVVEEAMQFAFDALSQDTLCEGAELNMRFVKPKSRCSDCGCEFNHDVYNRICPECQSPFTELIEGKELYIDKIEVDIPEDDESS